MGRVMSAADEEPRGFNVTEDADGSKTVTFDQIKWLNEIRSDVREHGSTQAALREAKALVTDMETKS